jgi:ABC-type sugar transport system permease subunit
VVLRVRLEGHRRRPQHHSRRVDGSEGAQGAGRAAEVGGVARTRALPESAVAWLFTAPALLGIALVVVFPLVYSLWLSFTDVNLLRSTGPALELGGLRIPLYRFIGIRNYAQALSDPLYWDSLWRTLYFVAAFVAEATVVGLGMALVLNERFPGRPLLRSLLLVPWSLSRIVVGLLWIGILDFEFGALNGLLQRAGLIDGAIAFFKDGFSALNVLVSVYMWNQAPFASLLFLAGMQSISEDQYAAAEVDGAGYWRRLWYVTLPALRPIVFLVLVLATVNGFLMLDLIYILTMGGPANDTTTVSWLGFKTTFTFFKFGPGTAILYTLTALCLLLTVLYQRVILARFEPEG